MQTGNEALSDTPEEIRQMVRARLVQLSGAERMKTGSEMFEPARRMILASLARKKATLV